MGLRRFLIQLGVPSHRQSITAEMEHSMNGQPPITYWRNATQGLPAAAADARTANEGLHLAMCLQAGNNAKYMREIISRRLLGLQIVLSDTNRPKDQRWQLASTLLPLNGLSSISLPVQQMMEKHARRSRKLSTSSSRSIGNLSSSSRGGSRRGRGGRGGRWTHSDRDGYNSGGYNSGAERPQSSRSRGGGGGHRGGRGGNSHSGASPAASNRGSPAGGSGATQS